MGSDVRSVVPVVYVSDVGRAAGFYELLGLSTQGSGADGTWRWAFLQCGEHGILLASDGSSPAPDPGPAFMYVNVGDLTAVTAALRAVGVEVEHLGYPDHAPGGEARVTDPDGHGILVGQPTGVPGADRQPAGDRGTLQAAAESVRRRGVEGQLCQVGTLGGGRCDRPAEVKLADSWGDTTWSCMSHADEVLLNAQGVFIATEDGRGLAQYLRVRRRSHTAGPVDGSPDAADTSGDAAD